MPIKITRTLFVGLGGTGVKAILRTKQCFMDAYGEIPPMVAFLAIDTDKKIRDQRLESRKGTDVSLTDNEVCFCPIDGAGNATRIYLDNQNEFGWMPRKNITFLQKLKNEGAGQVRTNGRFLARYNAVTISQHITAKVNEIGAPLPLDCKFEYDMNSQGMQYPTNINIVGSIAGGTGSGLMIDIINLVAHTMNGTGLSFRVFPWMVLPDVFRHMAPGVASQNVYANAYGVLTEMDYLYHLEITNNNPLNFGFANITSLDGSVYRTAIFNNKNKAGIVFQNIDEITDAIGRCMFLPANGVDGTSIEDNLSAASFAYNVRDKKANYSSAGCSELVYDNQAVGDVIARSIITDFCQEETRPTNNIDALNEANTWASSQTVGIEEHGLDLLTDSLLPMDWGGQIAFDRNSDVTYINTVIHSASEADYVKDEIKRNFENKKASVKSLLDEEINKYLKKSNGVGATISFLEALLSDIEQSKNEMISEKQECMDTIATNGYTNWDAELSNIRKPFWLGGGIDEDNANALAQTVSDHIAVKRDKLRHDWAIQFYTDLVTMIEEKLTTYRQFSQVLTNISNKQKNEIVSIQRKAKTESKFQIYLHGDDVYSYNRPDLTSIITAFQTNNSIQDLIGSKQDYIESVLWNSAKVMPEVIHAVNITIEDKLSKMPEAAVTELMVRLKNLASPMWNTNLGGFVTQSSPLSGIFAIGCYDALNGILQEKYKHLFKIGSQDASFVTTRQTDRILLYRIECYSPIYAVNNLSGYKREAEEALGRDAYPVYYIDEQWHQRMEVEKFDIFPKSEGDKVLPNWVMAIVYNYIQYDQTNKTYYIMSENHGDILSGGYLPLGARRDVAFDAFKNMKLYEEIENNLQSMILEKGRPQVDSILKNVKSDIINYVVKYAQLSDIELDMVKRRDSAYQMVTELLVKEVNHLRSLSL